MNTRTGKPLENKSQPVANEVAQMQGGSGTAIQFIDNRPEATRMQHQQEMVNNSSLVKQLNAYQAMADSYAAATAQRKENRDKAVIQRKIGEGGILNNGRLVIGPRGRRFVIVNQQIFLGRLMYKLADRGGSNILVDFADDNYNFDKAYTGVLGFAGLEEEEGEGEGLPYNEGEELPEDGEGPLTDTGEQPQPIRKRRRVSDKKGNPRKKVKTLIKFSIARREKGPRTNTTFENPKEAIGILTAECGLTEELATSLVEKKDWSYPKMQSLMSKLQEDGTLQPGMGEGARIWKTNQKVGTYSAETTENGSPLAQIVGCHLMEYQETNNGTQGPRQSQDLSRQKQLALSEAILQLPPEQVPVHSLGVGQPDHVKLFPALFDVKFEDDKNKVFSKPAGSLTFKLYQSAVKDRDQQYDHTHTLVNGARKNRKDKTKAVLNETAFDVDSLERFKGKDENYLKTYLGLKDTESDNSMDEEEEWKSPYSVEVVGQWTLREFYGQVYKQNVYSGVLFKESASKLAELDVLESQPPEKQPAKEKIVSSRNRRKRVQSRVKSVNDALLAVMKDLNINVVKLYERLQQWDKKKNVLDSIETKDVDKQKEIAKLIASLDEYIQMKLSELQKNGYPTPLKGVGEKKFEELGWIKPPAKGKREKK